MDHPVVLMSGQLAAFGWGGGCDRRSVRKRRCIPVQMGAGLKGRNRGRRTQLVNLVWRARWEPLQPLQCGQSCLLAGIGRKGTLWFGMGRFCVHGLCGAHWPISALLCKAAGASICAPGAKKSPIPFGGPSNTTTRTPMDSFDVHGLCDISLVKEGGGRSRTAIAGAGDTSVAVEVAEARARRAQSWVVRTTGAARGVKEAAAIARARDAAVAVEVANAFVG